MFYHHKYERFRILWNSIYQDINYKEKKYILIQAVPMTFNIYSKEISLVEAPLKLLF